MKSKTFYKSRSNQNLSNFKKKNNLSLKYTNTFIFGKRELELLQTENAKSLKRKESIFHTLEYNSKSKNPKKSIFEKNNFFTINSFSSFSSNTKRKLSLKKSHLYNLKKNSIPKLFLTEEALLQNKIIKKSETKNLSEQNFFKTEMSDIYQKQKQSKNSINFLRSMEKDLKEYRARNKDNNLINKKNEKLQLHNKLKSRRGFITNLNKYKYLEYLTKLQKEREKEKRENKNNELIHVQEKLNSLKDILKLFSFNFINGISDYLRHLDSMKNHEYTKNTNLLKEKNRIKREIVQINIDIEKVKQKKEEILRWVYLQIKVKERKLILPIYYKKIIEANKAELLYMEEKFDDNFNHFDIKRERGDKKRAQKLKRSYLHNNSNSKNLKIDNDTFDKKNKNKFLYRSQKTVFNRMTKKEFNLIENHSFEKSGKNKSKSKMKIFFNDINNKKLKKEFDFLSKDEFNKIVFWKFRPIYQTVDEFMESLNCLDSENILLIEHYNELQFKIYTLRQELVKLINSRDIYDLKIEEQLIKQTSLLEKLKNKYNKILKIYEQINGKNNNNANKNNKNENSKGFSEKDINKLYNKINIIFDNCKSLNNQKLSDLIYNIKSEETKEGEMLYLIEYIECILDFLFEKISFCNRDKNLRKKVHEEKIKIERQHRLEKPNLQRIEDRKKYINLIKKIIKRSQKQYITPTRHLDLIHYDFRKLVKNKNKKEEIIDDFPNLDEFIENPNIINNNDENILNNE